MLSICYAAVNIKLNPACHNIAGITAAELL